MPASLQRDSPSPSPPRDPPPPPGPAAAALLAAVTGGGDAGLDTGDVVLREGEKVEE